MPRRPHDGLGLGVRRSAVLAPEGAGQPGGGDADEPVGAAGGDVGVDDLHTFTAELKMQNKESHTINRNFKVTPTVDTAIDDYAAELGVSDSRFMRQSVLFCGDLFLACPDLMKLDRRELAELAANIGKDLVIHPRTVEWGKK